MKTYIPKLLYAFPRTSWGRGNGYLGVVIWIVFVLAVVGLVINLTRQGTLYMELEEIKNGKS